jgi:ribonuclease D
MAIRLHHGDLPETARFSGAVAVDTETLGLNPLRDRLCLVQLSAGDGDADIVRIARGQTSAPNLARLLGDASLTKIFHFARFDVAVLFHAFGVMAGPLYCTKIASRLTRTYTDRHGLKDLAKDLLDVDLSKQQQSSDWAGETLSEAQLAYAAADVLHLHALKEKLDERLDREGRRELAEACFGFLPVRARLDLAGWGEEDIFAH